MPALMTTIGLNAQQYYSALERIRNKAASTGTAIAYSFRAGIGGNADVMWNKAVAKGQYDQARSMMWWNAAVKHGMSGQKLWDDAIIKGARDRARAQRFWDDAVKKGLADQQAAYQKTFMGRVTTGVSSIAGSLVGQFLGVYAVMRVFQSIKQFAIDAVQAQIALQRIKNTLQSVSGSAAEAGRSFQFLLSEARRIGFSLAENADNFARFSIAAKNANYTAKETENVFTAVMEASAVMGLGTQRTSDALLALEQMLSKGKVAAEELRRQLGNAMPAAINIMARGLGMTLPQMYKALEMGAIDASKAVKLFGLELQKSFTLTPEMNKTVRDLSRVSTEWFLFKGQFGKLVAPDLSAFLTDLREAVKLMNRIRGGGSEEETGPPKARPAHPGAHVLGELRVLAGMAWVPALEPIRKLAQFIESKEAKAAKGKEEAARAEREADEIAALRAGAAPDQAARIAAVTAEVQGKEDLLELLLKELQIRNLLRETITGENRIALQTALGQTELQQKRLTAEGAVEKARVDVEIAEKRKADAAAAVAKAKKDAALYDLLLGGESEREAAKLEGDIKTAQGALDAETLAEKAAKAALGIAIAGEKPKTAKGAGGSADVTEWQRLSAYAGGDTVMVNEAKLTNRNLGLILRAIKDRGGIPARTNYGD